jgi:hypothetical protein
MFRRYCQNYKLTDKQTFSVIFGYYVAETDTKLRERKSCNLAIPVIVNSGVSLGIYKIDYRGFADVPETTGKEFAKFYANYFFA